jgi:hypothetical protein
MIMKHLKQLFYFLKWLKSSNSYLVRCYYSCFVRTNNKAQLKISIAFETFEIVFDFAALLAPSVRVAAPIENKYSGIAAVAIKTVIKKLVSHFKRFP